MNDLFDFDHDGKLDPLEREIKMEHELGIIDDDPDDDTDDDTESGFVSIDDDEEYYGSTGRYSNSTKSTHSSTKRNTTTSSYTQPSYHYRPTDDFLLAIGCAFLAACAYVSKILLGWIRDYTGFAIVAAVGLGIAAVFFIFRGIWRCIDNPKVATIVFLGIFVIALIIGGVALFTRKHRQNFFTRTTSTRSYQMTEDTTKKTTTEKTTTKKTTTTKTTAKKSGRTTATEKKSTSTVKKNSGRSRKSSYGRSDRKNIDADDLDVEGYYEDYRDDFEDIDDAWDDLMDNPDEWDDYD